MSVSPFISDSVGGERGREEEKDLEKGEEFLEDLERGGTTEC